MLTIICICSVTIVSQIEKPPTCQPYMCSILLKKVPPRSRISSVAKEGILECVGGAMSQSKPNPNSFSAERTRKCW